MAQSFNQVTLIGRLTKDAELKKTSTDKSVCPFTIAVDKLGKDAGASFFDCESWNGTAEFVGRYLKKGDLVLVSGRLDQQTWETPEGQKRSTVRVIANTVQSLSSKKQDTDSGNDAPANVEEMGEQISLEDVPF